MAQAINQVFKYVSEHEGFRASLGVISSPSASKTILAWGAFNERTEERWVPELKNILHSWPDASWTPMTQKQASLFDEAYQREQKPRQDWLISF